VIVLAHEGAICQSGGCRGEIIDFARRLDSGSVDLIVAGHTHRRVNTVVNGIPIVEAASSGRAVAVVDFVRVGGRGGRRDVRAHIVTPYTAAVRPDPDVAALVARYAQAVDRITSRVVARLRVALPREETEYPLGRLIADAFRAAAKADVCLVNTSGIRDGLPAGPVTYGQLFQVLPFQNRLVRLRVTGAVLLDALEHALRGGDVAAHVSGVEVWFDPGQPAGRRVARTRLADGHAIDPRRAYTLAVPDFLAGGGSGYAMLVSLPTEETGIVDIDAVIRHLAALGDSGSAPPEPRLHRVGR
jgi:2',3'-cyclic-nucleotide 2'-phosphodiesterase (5'-nucleotidase family)